MSTSSTESGWMKTFRHRGCAMKHHDRMALTFSRSKNIRTLVFRISVHRSSWHAMMSSVALWLAGMILICGSYWCNRLWLWDAIFLIKLLRLFPLTWLGLARRRHCYKNWFPADLLVGCSRLSSTYFSSLHAVSSVSLFWWITRWRLVDRVVYSWGARCDCLAAERCYGCCLELRWER